MQCLAIASDRARATGTSTHPGKRKAESDTTLKPGNTTMLADTVSESPDGVEAALRRAYAALDAQYDALDAIARELEFDLEDEPSDDDAVSIADSKSE